MFQRVRRFFDVRAGEGLPVLLAFLYIAAVVASFVLSRAIRNSLFLKSYGPYALVNVYAAVPIALSLFVPAYTRVAARFGTGAVTVWTLVFFSGNVLLFWFAFRHAVPAAAEPGSAAWLLPAVFYVWVNCYGIIAPVQAWSFANSLFDTRQARRLFGLIGAGGSLGAITGGLLARFLVTPVGGTVNMMLVLAALILSAAAIVTVATIRIRRRGFARRRRNPARNVFFDGLRQIAGSRYLRLIAALVFLVAIVTQWTSFQLSLVVAQRFGSTNTDAITRFNGTFNYTLGTVAFVLQLLLTGPALRRFGLVVTILLLPFALGAGSLFILLAPAFGPVLLTNAFDQGLRFGIDKSTYELLYLPLPPAQRAPIKNAIDIVITRFADAAGALMLGLATRGFFVMKGFGLGLRGTAAINLCLISVWVVVAWLLRTEYVRTIHESIHRYRLDIEGPSPAILDRTAADAVSQQLSATDPTDVRNGLSLVEGQYAGRYHDTLTKLLSHGEADIRRRALTILAASGDRTIAGRASEMLRDPDLGVRTEALLYVTRELGVDPLRQLQSLGDFEDFSIRAGMAAFFAAPGRSRNLDAARLIIETMARSDSETGARDRLEAARLLAILPESFADLLIALVGDSNPDVARQAIRSAHAVAYDVVRPALLAALGRKELSSDAASALAHYGDAAIPDIETQLRDDEVPVEIRRELPGVLVRIGTTWAERVLVESLLQADATLRHRVVVSLNQLSQLHRDVQVDRQTVELLLAAEIAGHYRSYQVLGQLRSRLSEDDAIIEALHQSMEQELERIFRLLALLHPGTSLHDAYVGVRSPNTTVRANALEFLDNILKPDLRQTLVPLLDSHVTVDERIAIADRLVGASLETPESAVAALLGSGDAWLRSNAVYAVGALQLHGLEGELRKLHESPDPLLREGVEAALQRLRSEAEPAEAQAPAPADLQIGVG